MKINIFYKLLAFAIFIAFIIFLFPHAIYIQDALSLEPVAGYGIKISTWRILFEPILGPLLFFKRSLYALGDMANILLWILLIFVIYSFLNIFRSQAKSRKKRILNQLAKLPLLVGLWVTVFTIIIFLELPNNTIINNSESEVLITTHAHTEYSHDGIITQERQWEWHKKNGFDAFFITDHGNHLKTLEFIAQQQKGEFPQKPFVLAGQEYSGSNHMSLLGLDGSFQTKKYSDSTIIDSVHYYGGAVIVNHWFDGKGKSMRFYKELGVDGFEIENVGKEYYYDRIIFKKLKNYCEQNNLLMVGGLDYHGYGRACGIWNAFSIPNWSALNFQEKKNAVLTILRNRDQSKLRVLMYIDRPFYEQNSIFSPFVTLFYYFRTLNGYQVFSWFVWLILFGFAVKIKLIKPFFTPYILPIISGLGALFMLVLAINYYVAQQKVLGYTDVYQEYATLLFPIGALLLIYSVFLVVKQSRKEVLK